MVLEHDADGPALGRDPDTAGGVVEDEVAERDPAPVEGDEPGERPEQRRLARAVRAQHRDGLATGGDEVDGEVERAEAHVDRGREGQRISHRSRSETSTTSDTATSTRLRTMAAPVRPDSKSR